MDLSDRDALRPLAQIVADLAHAAPGVDWLIVGATARDIHLRHARALAVVRATVDIDFAFAAPDWNAFDATRARLADSSRFEPRAASHAFRHYSNIPVDLIPFGGLETPDRTLEWPPGHMRMDAAGYREAMSASLPLRLPDGVEARVASAPGLILLKLLAWQDRHREQPGKDASDLSLLLRHYADLDGERLFGVHGDLLDLAGFDYVLAGARMAGRDVAGLLRQHGDATAGDIIARLLDLLDAQCDEHGPLTLAIDADRFDPQAALERFIALRDGLREHF